MTTTALAYVSEVERAIVRADAIPEIQDIESRAKHFRNYMREVGIDLEHTNKVGRIVIEAGCKGSVILESMGLKGKGAHKKQESHNVTLEELGLARMQALRWHKTQAIGNREDYYRDCDVNHQEVSAAGLLRSSKDGVYTSLRGEWNTPVHIVNLVVAVLGHIDLDPCSNDGQPNIPAKLHFRETDNGLAQPWVGTVYMNPPYGNEIGHWVQHLYDEFAAGSTTEAIVLLPSRTDTEWFRVLRDFPKCFVSGRLKFSESETPAPFPSVVVYLGERMDAFANQFSCVGDIYQRISG